MNSAEVLLNRRNTRAFIDANPSTIILTRLPDFTDDGAGGVIATGSNTTLEGQRVRVIPQTNGNLRQTIEGEQVQTTHVLLGDIGFDVQRGDFFTLNQQKIEVTFLWPPNQYEVRAEAASRA